jgi:hypothetical protein
MESATFQKYFVETSNVYVLIDDRSKSQENYKPKGNVRQASIYESTQPQKHKSTAVAQYIKVLV